MQNETTTDVIRSKGYGWRTLKHDSGAENMKNGLVLWAQGKGLSSAWRGPSSMEKGPSSAEKGPSSTTYSAVQTCL